jgi:hypothetical protein
MPRWPARARQGDRQGEREPDPPLVVAEHRRQPAADAAPVQPVRVLGRERGENLLALTVRKHSDVQLVMMAAEVSELSLLGNAGPLAERAPADGSEASRGRP